tara:strand:+ start:413 stop:853 length:441 start_codon:yes stop_codon:yes gene_type:complete
MKNYERRKRMGKKQPRNSSYSYFNSSVSCLALLFLVGCTSLKKAVLIGGGSLGAGAIASIATSGTAPVLLASAVGASVTSVAVDVMTPMKGDNMPTAASCAPDNFWTLLGDLVSMGGWLLILVIIIPMILGWLLPGPLERAKKKRK